MVDSGRFTEGDGIGEGDGAIKLSVAVVDSEPRHFSS